MRERHTGSGNAQSKMNLYEITASFLYVFDKLNLAEIFMVEKIGKCNVAGETSAELRKACRLFT